MTKASIGMHNIQVVDSTSCRSVMYLLLLFFSFFLLYKSFIHQELVVHTHTHTQKNTQKTNLNILN